MCNIKKTYRPGMHAQVGYKVAIKDEWGYLLSPATNALYVKGKVNTPSYPHRRSRLYTKKIATSDALGVYNPLYVGCTAIFKYKRDAIKLMRCIETSTLVKRRSYDKIGEIRDTSSKVVLLKMTLGGIKYRGEYGEANPIWMGTKIISMRIIQTR